MRRTALFLSLISMVGLSACIPPSDTPKVVAHVGDAPLVIQPVNMDMGSVMEGKDARERKSAVLLITSSQARGAGPVFRA